MDYQGAQAMTRSSRTLGQLTFLLVPAFCCGTVAATDSSDATTSAVNFTGPLLTPNPQNLPAGTWLVEPYLIHNSSSDAYNDQWDRYAKDEGTGQWLTIVPVFYGVTDRLQLQLTAGLARSDSAGSHTSGFGLTDTTISAQYMLIAPDKSRDIPAVSVRYSHQFPTGPYDHLGSNPLNGTGNGASTDTFSVLAQQYIWFPNGRPLRVRAAVSYTLPPNQVAINGVSVYGTPQDFRGQIRLGSSFGVSVGAEYSIDPQWVLALDVAYNRVYASQLQGVQDTGTALVPLESRNPTSKVVSLAPAIEYNFNDRIGVIGGVQFSAAGRNSDAFITPQVAVNMVF
ncbi:hypothetical protein DWU99_01430 [Dyella psychrodurans]|uniref:Transporter n=2 Tax=Dyella psychrodurans TaxID=1927960 RepID=A0A370XC31_9GAMM|nr:hypothetical protein DWU99_01430 [Dyella psychrodurans]